LNKSHLLAGIFWRFIVAAKVSKIQLAKISQVRINGIKLKELIISIFIIFFLALTIERQLVESFGLLWVLVFFSLIPLEWLFQNISRLRSKRNMIYVIYILICLLDSHFEGRIKILSKLF
jgi:hypothetical protein